MADERLTDRTTLSELADGDLIHVVDISDTTDNPLGTSKKGLWSLFKSTLLTYFNTQYLRSVTGDSVNNADPLNPVVNAIPLSGTEVGSPVTGNVQFQNDTKLILNDVGGDIGFIQGRTDGIIEIGSDAYPVLISADTGLNVTNEIQAGGGIQGSGTGNELKITGNDTGKGLVGEAYYGANYTDNTYVQKKYVDDKYNVSGTTNYISKFTGSNSIGNSQIYDNGTNVGIGTTSPSYKLHVSGTGRFTGTTLFQSQLTVAESFGDSVLEVGNSGMGGNHRINIIAAGSGQDAGYYISGTPRVYTNTGNTSITRINAPSTGIIQFETNLTERVRINNGGNVSIGNQNNTYKLDVSGTGRFTNTLTVQGTGDSSFAGNVGIGNTSPDRKLRVLDSAIVITKLEGTSQGSLLDLVNSNASQTYNGLRFTQGTTGKMAITHIADGTTKGYIQIGNSWIAGSEILVVDGRTSNVGIGTTSPTAKLHVVGLPTYADNATALAGGLTVGAFYHTAGVLKVVI